MDFHSFMLKGKKVLITGADGFIGSHLAEALLAEGCEVRAFVYYNSLNSWGWLDTFSKDQIAAIEVVSGDIRDANCVRKAMKGVDVVFHLAALIAIPYSYDAPESYIDTNVKGTLNVLQAAQDLGTSRVLVTSTSEVYGTANYVPIDESHPKQAQSPYSASKIAADCLAESFFRSFQTPVTIVRPFNTYGPRQSARAVIPTIISQLLNGAAQIKLGDLSPTRDLLFVKDTVRGFIQVANSSQLVGESVNIATNDEISIKELAEKIILQINPSATIVQDSQRLRPANSEVFRLCGDNSKLTGQTAWKPEYNIDQGLAHTIEWMRIPENLSKYKANIYNV
ncbi:NAD-dependent 4,6-dehydratase LegB [Cytophagaceae bacterium ABcell3]|nr:NAD-dependent 4,6-dehydratase LegB [Cytophagaceae bacterium ABcell3]